MPGPGLKVLCAAALLLAASCSSGLGDLPQLAGAEAAEFRLGTGDELRIVVPGLSGTDPTGNTTYAINDRGELSLPVLGAVPAAGLTVSELEKSIAAKLVAGEYLVAPSVSIQPVKLRPVYVTGEVRNPGEYQFRPGMAVLAAVSAAGGYTYRAVQGRVAITRVVGGRPVTTRASDTSWVMPGDTIVVYEKWF
ncbi:polysaccharide biosynthesis/export family protein [Sphingosinicella sp. BN140058]|uniref:polysaccharide biosynthesis/export family protein n=1 Tax=Sphingosinicella sp. BN140058 TaxID=1892855 RepID=UPI0010127A72|nr:polysaccharide biosynthesis/export family protein [Sphingosinicella sp. BN140058]QAY78037.1 polysaccharide export protein [Sphingosinicella sp. BN140058]